MGFEKSTEAIREGWPLFIIGGIGEIGIIGEIRIIGIIGVIKMTLIIPIAPLPDHFLYLLTNFYTFPKVWISIDCISDS